MSRLSIILAATEEGAYIEDTVHALRNAVAGSNVDTELVVVASSENLIAVQRALAGAEGIAVRSIDTHSLARLYNFGADEIQGDRLLFLREGILLHAEGLRLMLDTLELDPKIGAAGAFSNRTTYGRQYLNAARMEADGIAPEEYLRERAVEATESIVLENFALLIRREIFVQVGKFCEEFPAAGGEDIDLSFWLKLAGYRLLCVPAYFEHAGANVCELYDMTRTLARPLLLERWGLDIGIPEKVWWDALAGLDWRQDVSLIRATCRSALLRTPLVSIMIPTYNRPEYFRETLESARAQTYPNIEIIVCDNGTDDRTEALMKDYRDDLRIRYVRNRGARSKEENFMPFEYLAQGEYLQWCMDDDILLPDKLTLMTDVLLRFPQVTLVTSWRGVIDGKGAFLGQWDAPALCGRMEIMKGDTLAHDLLVKRNNFIGEPAAVLFRRCDLTHHYWRAESRGYLALSDCAMWLELLERGDGAAFNHPLSLFRVHQEQEGRQPEVIIRFVLEWQRLIGTYYRRNILTDREYSTVSKELYRYSKPLITPLLPNISLELQRAYQDEIVQRAVPEWDTG